MKIDISEVEQVARLARLKVSPEHATRLMNEMNNILVYMEKLNELDTSGIQPMAHPLTLATPYREDRAKDSLDPEKSLANAPAKDGSFFLVPKVI